MTIKLLGTAAAEAIPAFTCGCRVCEHARRAKGPEVRTRSGAIIDGHLKIDLPPDTILHMHREDLDSRDWTGLLFTHSHDDHFAPRELQYVLAGFSDLEYAPFTIYGNGEICRVLENLYPQWPFEVVQSRSFEPFRHMDYTITPIRANHLENEDAQNHLIEQNGTAVLYATDTGVWQDRTFEFLQGRKLKGLVIECTEGFHAAYYSGHLNTIEVLHVLDRLRGQGSVDDATRVVTTHHSHNGNATYAELKESLEKEGIVAGYDGLEISF